MYLQHFGLREKPFSLLPDPAFLYPSKQHHMAMVLLEYSLTNQAGFSVITGGIGTGKTTLIRHLLNRLEQDVTVGLITNTHRSFGDVLAWVLMAFNLRHEGQDKVRMYQTFVDFLVREYAHNRRTILIVDEAQNMTAETLEELRMLSNVNADKDQVLQVFLVGQSNLRDLLRRPDLEQFAQRIVVDYHLDALEEADTIAYIGYRLKTAGGNPDLFEVEAARAIHRFSRGIPRLINLLCDTALVYAYAEKALAVSLPLVLEVAREKQKGGIFPGARRTETPPVVTPLSPAQTAAPPSEPRRLRVAILSDLDARREYLRNVLDQCGMLVSAALPLSARPIQHEELNQAEILFADLNEEDGQILQHLDTLLGTHPLPVLFNDSSEKKTAAQVGSADFRKRLTLKLSSLVRPA